MALVCRLLNLSLQLYRIEGRIRPSLGITFRRCYTPNTVHVRPAGPSPQTPPFTPTYQAAQERCTAISACPLQPPRLGPRSRGVERTLPQPLRTLQPPWTSPLPPARLVTLDCTCLLLPGDPNWFFPEECASGVGRYRSQPLRTLPEAVR